MGKFIDLTGKCFGRLTVLHRALNYIQPNGKSVVMWECKCECGNNITVSGSSLKSGNTKSCGCLSKDIRIKNGKQNGKNNLIDLTGKRFGRLSVIEKSSSDKNGCPKWKCVCDCGNEVIVYGHSLRYGVTKSCGCLAKEKSSERLSVHNLSKNKLHSVWSNMKYRCTNPNAKAYKHYGERGITVCDEWNDFLNFYNWAINNGYEEGLSIDRIDVNGNYEPSNCRWVTSEIQANNQRNNRIVLYEGNTYTVAQLMKKLNMPRNQIIKMYEN